MMKFSLLLISIIFLISCNSMKAQNTEYMIWSLWVQEFQEKIQSEEEGVRLIDIRDPIELEMFGMLAWAERITYNSPNFIETLEVLPRDERYYIYCNSGNRTNHTLQIMQEMWFEYVMHLDGGIQAWMKAGKKVEQVKDI